MVLGLGADLDELKRRVRTNGRMAARYDSVLKTTKEPTNALNAAEEPT